MQTTKLETVEQITAAIRALEGERRARGHRQVKPAQNREEAARFADLYEMRARMWFDMGTAARLADTIPDAYADACAVASKHDQDEERHWRGLAGAR
jgi:hypothetical protein